MLIFFISGFLFLCHEHVIHRERIAPLLFAKTPARSEINDITIPGEPPFSPETPEARLLSRRNLDDLESKLAGFRLEVFDL